MDQPTVTAKVTEALTACGFLTTVSLASGIGCGRGAVINAYDEIEAAGMKLMRVRGVGGGAQFVGKTMRRRAA